MSVCGITSSSRSRLLDGRVGVGDLATPAAARLGERHTHLVRGAAEPARSPSELVGERFPRGADPALELLVAPVARLALFGRLLRDVPPRGFADDGDEDAKGEGDARDPDAIVCVHGIDLRGRLIPSPDSVWQHRVGALSHLPRNGTGGRPGGGEAARQWSHLSATLTPPLNGESCSSAISGVTPSGRSKTRVPFTVLPGLISSNHTSSLPSR